MWSVRWGHLALLQLLTYAAGQILNLEQGESCKTIDGKTGSCALLSGCRDPGDFRRDHPPICSFKGIEPIICCPTLVTQRDQDAGLKARQYCRSFTIDYNRMNPTERGNDCSPGHRLRLGNRLEEPTKAPIADGDNTTRLELSLIENTIGGTTTEVYPPPPVVGGNLVEPRKHKHMVLIGYGPSSNIQWGCGGSLISARYVLSAAHCALPQGLGPARMARLGDLDISTDKDDAKIQERRIVERITHPQYKEPKVYNDIALFKMEKDVVFNAWVSPVCLHTTREIPETVAIVTGWGRVDFAGATSDHLLEAELDIYNDTECARLNNVKDNKTPQGIDSNLMFCAGKSDGSKDACSGDSGGPLVLKQPGNCLKTQIGVTSYGKMCALKDSPGVYTRVSTYIGWIESIAFK